MARPIVVPAALAFVASQAPVPDPVRSDPDAPRPIPARDTVFMEDMTWMEVRDAMNIKEYYSYPAVEKWLEAQGIVQTPEGLHDDFAITAQMTAVDPKSVRAEERIKAGRFRINGVDLAPVEKTAAWGWKIADYRAEATIAALRRAMATSK